MKRGESYSTNHIPFSCKTYVLIQHLVLNPCQNSYIRYNVSGKQISFGIFARVVIEMSFIYQICLDEQKIFLFFK